MEGENHPVWDLYDEYRTTRLNTLYYEKELAALKHRNSCIEIFLALTASSGIAGLWFWETFTGGLIWKGILTITAILAVVKPIVNLAAQIQQKSELLEYWRSQGNDLNILVILTKQRKSYDNEIRNRFISIMEAKKSIIRKEPAEGINEKLRERCYNQVNKELPSGYFFIPEE